MLLKYCTEKLQRFPISKIMIVFKSFLLCLFSWRKNMQLYIIVEVTVVCDYLAPAVDINVEYVTLW